MSRQEESSTMLTSISRAMITVEQITFGSLTDAFSRWRWVQNSRKRPVCSAAGAAPGPGQRRNNLAKCNYNRKNSWPETSLGSKKQPVPAGPSWQIPTLPSPTGAVPEVIGRPEPPEPPHPHPSEITEYFPRPSWGLCWGARRWMSLRAHFQRRAGLRCHPTSSLGC